MSNGLRFGSVCSGIEAASVAWHPLGWKAAWLAEIEPFPSAVLAHHYPAVPNLGDMNNIVDHLQLGVIEPPDVLCGGTPCQAFSVAGLRQSLDDARGNLSLTFCEIANEIDVQRELGCNPPVVVFWENVPGVLSTKDNAFGCFLAGLAGEDDALVVSGGKWPNAGVVVGPKRAVAWRVLDAQYFGLAQRRRRVFVVASARDGFDPAAVLFEFEGVRRDTAPSRFAGQDIAPTLDVRAGRSGETSFHTSGGFVPYAPEIARCDATREGSSQDFETTTMVAQSVALRGRDGGATAEVGDDCAFALRASGGGGDKPHVLVSGQESLAPWEQQGRRIQGVDGVAPTLMSNPAGGMKLEPVLCITGDVTHTLKAEGLDASEDGTGQGQPHVLAFQSSQSGVRLGDTHATLDANNGPRRHNGALVDMAVRRLTPVECARLQGFPDKYLDVTVRGKPAADGPKYKALGNSWAVPVVRWIGTRIDAAVKELDLI